MKWFRYSALVLIIFVATSMKTVHQKPDDNFCGISNKAFSEGELLTYTVFYNVAGVYVNAGNATFSKPRN